jgi:hypothetical protein
MDESKRHAVGFLEKVAVAFESERNLLLKLFSMNPIDIPPDCRIQGRS